MLEEQESLLSDSLVQNPHAYQNDDDESGELFNESPTYQSFPDVEANTPAHFHPDEEIKIGEEIRERGNEPLSIDYVIPSNQVSSIYEGEGNRKINCLKKVGKGLVGGVEVVEEGIEGLSISYSQYLVVVDPAPNLQKHYNYAFVAAGTVVGGLVELLHLFKVLSDKQHHNYRLAKEAVAGAAVGAIYAERIAERLIVKFSSEEPAPVTLILIGTSVFVLLASSKSLIEIFKHRAFFKTKLGKIIEYLAGGTYNLLMGAGICDYTFEICEGFGSIVSLPTQICVTAAVAVTNLLADLPIAKYRKTHQKDFLYHLAHCIRAGFFGIEVALILIIMYFDVTFNIQESTRMTNTQFGFGIGVPAVLSGIITAFKLMNDKKEEHFEEENGAEERLSSINEGTPESSYFSLKSVSKRWPALTNSEVSNEDRQLREIVARHRERKPSSSCWPSFTWLRNCFKHEDNSPEETIQNQVDGAEETEGRNYFNSV